MPNTSYPNTTVGSTAALDAVANDQTRLWYDGDTIRIVEAQAPIVPNEVTRAQAKVALLRAGKLVATQTAVASIGGEAQIWWDEAITFKRTNPLVVALGQILGMTPSQLDALFIEAAGID